MTDTIFIPQSTKEKPPVGWVIALTKDTKRAVPFYYDGTSISYITMRDQYDYWLQGVDRKEYIRQIAGEAWEAGIERFCFDNGSEFVEGTPPKKSEYLNPLK